MSTPQEQASYITRVRDALKSSRDKDDLYWVGRLLDEPEFEALPPANAEALLIEYNHRWAELSGSAVWS